MAVPDAASGETGVGSTSNRNRTHGNVMGIAPDGGKLPNGVDHWWDGYPGNTDNCWFNNGAATTDPPGSFMPSNCKNTSSGAFYPSRAPELGPLRGRRCWAAATCAPAAARTPSSTRTPASGSARRPSPARAADRRAAAAPAAAAGQSCLDRDFAEVVSGMCDLVGSSTLSCKAFRGQR